MVHAVSIPARHMSKRLARLSEQLKREISGLVRDRVRDPRVGHVTITGVQIARDLGSARVYVRDVAGAEQLTETLEGLEAAAPFLRRELGRLLHIRRIPELRFREDRSYKSARRIEEVLLDVLPEVDVTEDGAHVSEAAPGLDPEGSQADRRR